MIHFSVSVKKPAYFQDWRKLGLVAVELGQIRDSAVALDEVNRPLNLLLARLFVPLLLEEVSHHLRQSFEHARERSTLAILLDDVEEPVLKMLLVGRSHDLAQVTAARSPVAVEHVDRDASVEGAHLVPIEGGDEEHLAGREDGLLATGVGEQGKPIQVGRVTVHLALHRFPVRAEGVRVEAREVVAKQSDPLTASDHHKEIVVGIVVAELKSITANF